MGIKMGCIPKYRQSRTIIPKEWDNDYFFLRVVDYSSVSIGEFPRYVRRIIICLEWQSDSFCGLGFTLPLQSWASITFTE
jgi:hypothetical protein